MKKLAYIDLETTGLDCKKDEIIRFCAMIIDCDGKTEMFDKYAKPRNPISPMTENFIKITNAFLENCKPSEIIKAEFLALIDNATIASTNLDFAERFLNTQFALKIDLSKDRIDGDTLIKSRINELKKLSDKDKILTSIVKCTLQRAYPKALEIIERLHSLNEKKFDINFFKMDKINQYNYLHSLINWDSINITEYDFDYVFKKLTMELERIEELNLVPNFLIAKSIAEILKTIDVEPHFIGIGCCSLIAYIMGITESTLNPLAHGLIFERGFKQDSVCNRPFTFYVEDDIKDELIAMLKELYGENIEDSDCNNEITLNVNDIQIGMVSNIENVQQYFPPNYKIIDNSTTAVFVEDYMRLLHFTGGYSYDESNTIRKAVIQRKRKETKNYRKDFGVRTSNTLGLEESALLFNDIAEGLNFAYSKAVLLSTKVILEYYYPF